MDLITNGVYGRRYQVCAAEERGFLKLGLIDD